MFGMVLTYAITIIITVLPIPLLFQPYRNSYIPYFETADLALASILTLFIILTPLISATFLVIIYKHKDL